MLSEATSIHNQPCNPDLNELHPHQRLRHQEAHDDPHEGHPHYPPIQLTQVNMQQFNTNLQLLHKSQDRSHAQGRSGRTLRGTFLALNLRTLHPSDRLPSIYGVTASAPPPLNPSANTHLHSLTLD
ncbi:hypothetical protein BJ085DRAFT_38024 [Dimargaris cristalligena]|uniref:Uncharacterized protein n=1 Tax=Dimargaris cristalligena TaxID=215637 RepID=A0A4P9ZIY4_9FUNG|nr:hypothetical protein BJ085DRAFT_38024 [Dimargaris cristalligena]|eukprot:RKP33157.1 hypothetical protein BJ085DRAFT_38024 [Dimargaris cristalligena]